MKETRFLVIAATLVLFQIFCYGCSHMSVNEKQATDSFLEGNWDRVVECGNKWIEEDQDNPVPHALLNIAYTSLDKHDSLKSELRAAYGSPRDVETVLSWSKNLTKDYPDNAKAYLVKGLAYEISGDNNMAINCYRSCMRVEPAFSQGYQSLGNLYMAGGQMDEAIKIYEEMLKNVPDKAGAYTSIGTAYALMHDMDKAVANLEKATELDPKDLDALYNLSMAYLESGNAGKGAALLLIIVQLDPDGELGRDAKNHLRQMIVR